MSGGLHAEYLLTSLRISEVLMVTNQMLLVPEGWGLAVSCLAIFWKRPNGLNRQITCKNFINLRETIRRRVTLTMDLASCACSRQGF